jgi:hypothetical protein
MKEGNLCHLDSIKNLGSAITPSRSENKIHSFILSTINILVIKKKPVYSMIRETIFGSKYVSCKQH